MTSGEALTSLGLHRPEDLWHFLPQGASLSLISTTSEAFPTWTVHAGRELALGGSTGCGHGATLSPSDTSSLREALHVFSVPVPAAQPW